MGLLGAPTQMLGKVPASKPYPGPLCFFAESMCSSGTQRGEARGLEQLGQRQSTRKLAVGPRKAGVGVGWGATRSENRQA